MISVITSVLRRPYYLSGPFIPGLGVGFGEKWQRVHIFFQKHDHAHMKIYLGDGCVSPVNPQAKLRFSLRVSKGLAREVKGPQTKRESAASFLRLAIM